jgi:hypothetical protein
MHLRRAMLLFAIVLGLAAMAAALTRPPAERANPRPAPPRSAVPARTPRLPAEVRLDTARRPRTRVVRAGRRTIVTVDVKDPGQVELAGLGLTASAEPLTPARFDVLAPKAGRYEVLYTPAGELASRRAGVLKVSSGGSSAPAGTGSER